MKNILKKTAAVLAAVTVISACPVTASADKLFTQDGLKYVQRDNGETAVYSGWTKKDGKRYCYKNGEMLKNCWLTVNGERTYFLKRDGSAAVGKTTVSGIEYEFNESGRLVKETWGVSLSAKDVTSTGLTIVIDKKGGSPTGELLTGSPFALERLEDGKWTAVTPIDDSRVWTAESHIISEKNSDGSIEMKTNWEYMYGSLDTGRYRVSKEIMDWRAAGDWDGKIYYAYFDIE